MVNKQNYNEEYFRTIYAPLKKEKSEVLATFYNLLIARQDRLKKVLDLGCGEGEFLSVCREKGIRSFGIDISSYALARAKKQVKAEFKQLDLECKPIPYPDDYFEAVTMFDLVEHLKKPEKVIKEARRVLKKRGILFLTTPNGGYWPKDFLGNFVINDPTHINIQAKDYWINLLKLAGFSQIELKGCLLFGLPPDMQLRSLFKSIGFPVLVKPIFFPLLDLTSALFIFARKN